MIYYAQISFPNKEHILIPMSNNNKTPYFPLLVGGFNPVEKFSQNGNLPQVGVKIKKYLKPPPRWSI